MSEETDAPQGGTEVVETSLVETPSEATTEQTTATETAAEPDAGEETEEPVKKVPWFQKRINEVTAKVYEKEAEIAYWRGVAQGQPKPQPAQQQDGPPQLEQFETYEDYERANIAFVVEQRLAQERQQTQRQAALRTHQEREAAFRAVKPDFDAIVGDPTLSITPAMAEVIRESDLGPQVAYHLGNHRDEAARIASLSPQRQAAELGKIEAYLTKAPTSSAKPIPPAPPQTVAGVSSGLSKPMTEMSYAEFVKMREAEEKTRN
jgi:hypothetical protein